MSPALQASPGILRAALAGWIGGLAGNALLGALFTSAPVQGLLYDPRWQSALFLQVTPQRNVAASVAGLVLLSAIHGALYAWLRPALPGRTSLLRGLFWGFVLWALYWLPQEWFIYVTLLQEPPALAAFELALLLAGALLEGVLIAWIVDWQPAAPD
jgi:hypothetical protein